VVPVPNLSAFLNHNLELFKTEQTFISGTPTLFLRDGLPSLAFRTMRASNPLIPSLRLEEKTNARISCVGFNCSLAARLLGVPRELWTHSHSARGWHHHAGLPLSTG
jgi:hypothetical protein